MSPWRRSSSSTARSTAGVAGGRSRPCSASAATDRRARLVYLDGFVPEHGESCWDVIDGSGWAEGAEAEGFGWPMPPVDREATYGITDPDDLAWMRDRLVPTTMVTHEEPLWAPEGRAATLPRTYIACIENDTFRGVAEAPGWRASTTTRSTSATTT